MTLLQVMADKLLQEAKNKEKVTEKILGFLKRIKLIKTIQYVYPIARSYVIAHTIEDETDTQYRQKTRIEI